MKIKNRTSSVPAERTIANIEFMLAKAGATHIAKEFEDGKCISFVFSITVNGNDVPFKLPSKINLVFERLWKEVPIQRVRDIQARKEIVYAQAERTAWKIVQDWIEINLSLIELEQATAAEIFMPYMYDYKNNQTLFEKFASGALPQLLGEGKK